MRKIKKKTFSNYERGLTKMELKELNASIKQLFSSRIIFTIMGDIAILDKVMPTKGTSGVISKDLLFKKSGIIDPQHPLNHFLIEKSKIYFLSNKIITIFKMVALLKLLLDFLHDTAVAQCWML